MTTKKKTQWGKRLANGLRLVNVAISEDVVTKIEELATDERQSPPAFLSDFIEENSPFIGVTRVPRFKIIHGHSQASFFYNPMGAEVWYGLAQEKSGMRAFVYAVQIGENDLLDSLSDKVKSEIQQQAEREAVRMFNRLVEANVFEQVALNQQRLSQQLKAELANKQETDEE